MCCVCIDMHYIEQLSITKQRLVRHEENNKILLPSEVDVNKNIRWRV